MICLRCLLRTPSRSILGSTKSQYSKIPSRRTARLFTTSANLANTSINPNIAQTSNEQRDRPAATSTSAAQPFSTPLYPSPGAEGSDVVPAKSKRPPPPKPISSVPAGTPLKGLNYFKNKSDPVALEDHEYPAWLWTSVLVDRGAGNAAAGAKEPIDPRLFAKSANVRKKANKRARAKEVAKARDVAAGAVEERVPLYEQTIDLELGDGTEVGNVGAAEHRRELTKAMRAKRRRDIKEGNFLKGV